MDYEKKYKEALIRARSMYESRDDAELAAYIFPELAESEDEKNANALIRLLNDDKITSLITYEAKQQWLNWLERKRTPSVSFDPPVGFDSGSAVVYHNEESEDERMLREFNDWLCEEIECRTNDLRDEKDRRTLNMLCYILTKVKDWLEKQKEIPMPDSTELIDMWEQEKKVLEEKDFRGDAWRIAYNAFMDGFARGTCVKFEKQKEQKPWKVGANAYFTPEQKPVEWSEEDERILKGIIGLIDHNQHYGVSNKEMLAWLKSLRPCPKQGWSEEDESRLDRAITTLAENVKRGSAREDFEFLASLPRRFNLQPKTEWSEEDRRTIDRACVALRAYANGELPDILPSEILGYADKLQSLRPSWKPSEEQMKALHNFAYTEFFGDGDAKAIRSLYDDLKKLI